MDLGGLLQKEKESGVRVRWAERRRSGRAVAWHSVQGSHSSAWVRAARLCARGWQQSGRRRLVPPAAAACPSARRLIAQPAFLPNPLYQAVDKAVDSAVANKDKVVAGIGQVSGGCRLLWHQGGALLPAAAWRHLLGIAVGSRVAGCKLRR